jgi:hypothetical protein
MMQVRKPDIEWMRKILADIERSRGDPQIAALMDDQLGDWVAAPKPAHAVDADLVPFALRSSHRDY